MRTVYDARRPEGRGNCCRARYSHSRTRLCAQTSRRAQIERASAPRSGNALCRFFENAVDVRFKSSDIDSREAGKPHELPHISQVQCSAVASL